MFVREGVAWSGQLRNPLPYSSWLCRHYQQSNFSFSAHHPLGTCQLGQVLHVAYPHDSGWPEPYIYGVYTVFSAGKSPNIRSYTVYIHTSGQPYIWHICRVGRNRIYTPYIRWNPCMKTVHLTVYIRFQPTLLTSSMAKSYTVSIYGMRRVGHIQCLYPVCNTRRVGHIQCLYTVCVARRVGHIPCLYTVCNTRRVGHIQCLYTVCVGLVIYRVYIRYALHVGLVIYSVYIRYAIHVGLVIYIVYIRYA